MDQASEQPTFCVAEMHCPARPGCSCRASCRPHVACMQRSSRTCSIVHAARSRGSRVSHRKSCVPHREHARERVQGVL
eukprot:6201260-Pleurochrysis_carterae.AAC.2